MKSISHFFVHVREALYECFSHRADAIFNLIDSLCDRKTAESPVELTLEAPFDRKYSSLFDAVDNFYSTHRQTDREKGREHKALKRIEALKPVLPKPIKRTFWLTGIDATSALRPYANTLLDRGIVYRPNPAPGNNPIDVGHSYSLLALLPEREADSTPWVVPLICQRVATHQRANEVAASQMKALLDDYSLPFGTELTVNTADSSYGKALYLSPVGAYRQHVEIVRVASNRKFYRVPAPQDSAIRSRGHPAWFGAPFDLKDKTTWRAPDEEQAVPWHSRTNRSGSVHLQRWNDLLMRGKRNAPMQERPFDLIRSQVIDTSGQPVFARPLWILVLGKQRRQISTAEGYEAYRQRYDLEHFFRFGKNKLLLDHYQTPCVEHEENWWELVCLAYTQLWLAAPLTQTVLHPWERYVPELSQRSIPSPTQVQRDFGRIIRQLGTPAKAPKPRGIPPGRLAGDSPGRRSRQPVMFKNRAPPRMAA